MNNNYGSAVKFADYASHQENTAMYQKLIVPPGVPERATWLYAPPNHPRETRVFLDTVQAIRDSERDNLERKFTPQDVPLDPNPRNPRDVLVKDSSTPTRKTILSFNHVQYATTQVMNEKRPVDGRQ